jgi:hypothetical protein
MSGEGDLEGNVPDVPPDRKQDRSHDYERHQHDRENVHAHHLVGAVAGDVLPGELGTL